MNVIKVSQNNLDAAFRQPVAALMSLRISPVHVFPDAFLVCALFVRCS